MLIWEAIEAPEIGAGCRLTGGRWWSYYDETWVTSASGLDVDHMVPLAEAWDSGASAWTPQRREAYANDQDALTSLVAVTARSNRAKADRDPAEWLPPAPSDEVRCRYAVEWAGTKLRWSLAADEAELAALQNLAVGCSTQTVTYEPAMVARAPPSSGGGAYPCAGIIASLCLRPARRGHRGRCQRRAVLRDAAEVSGLGMRVIASSDVAGWRRG
ncbi:hypothetical protein QF035_000098 [Streptomyces umbrinus]|uniref:GmrSD restriction endonucleases C-terminal domain-containing protein n=1 Tax=Streptomyces umbrinus TaxID=67370 RepID=A0ABU0SG45_9ACTN|nr:hypothetical protein [Streptomyces umbrinus]